ncbi:hypothetical protein Tco_1431133 [Tanacetum coccineum]
MFSVRRFDCFPLSKGDDTFWFGSRPLVWMSPYGLFCKSSCRGRSRFLEFCRRWQSLGKKYSRCVDDYRKQIQDIDKRTHAVNQQTSVVTTAMTAILKQFQATPPPASIKAVEEICVMYGGAHPYYQCLAADGNTFPKYRDNIQGYVAAATAMQAQINNVKNEIRNEMQSSIQASMSNQTNELKNMMASFFQMNTASTSGTRSLPSNTVANPKGELKAITT